MVAFTFPVHAVDEGEEVSSPLAGTNEDSSPPTGTNQEISSTPTGTNEFAEPAVEPPPF